VVAAGKLSRSGNTLAGDWHSGEGRRMAAASA
jgi:hypothetical protein